MARTTDGSESTGPKTFTLVEPFEGRGGRMVTELTARRPRVRDLRFFLKNVDSDAILAMEKTLGELTQEDDDLIANLSIRDFSIMKKWFESFLKHMMTDSDD